MARSNSSEWVSEISIPKTETGTYTCAFSVKEVATGYECGIGLENFNDVRVGDQFEVIEFVEVARKLGESLAEQKAREAKEAGEGAN